MGDNLHEMSNSVFWEKSEKYFKLSSAEIITQRAKHINSLLSTASFHWSNFIP